MEIAIIADNNIFTYNGIFTVRIDIQNGDGKLVLTSETDTVVKRRPKEVDL